MIKVNTFSERYGHERIKEIQFESIDIDLKNRLWNQINSLAPSELYKYAINYRFFEKIWGEYLALPLDEIYLKKGYEVLLHIKARYSSLKWNEVYDFLEYIINNIVSDINKKYFISHCNKILESEKAAYRIVGKEVIPITNKESIGEIEKALESQFGSSTIHLETALKLYSDRNKPDYRNSIKESISAVEALCRIITKNKKASLGETLRTLRNSQSVNIPPALSEGFSHIYGYTSSNDGIRHALTEMSKVGEEDARYMLIICSAFINYLLSKANKANLVS